MSNLIALPAGTELVGDYEIERVLGAGGFGITYLAKEAALARAVTIKEYFPADFAARDTDGDAAPRSEDSKGDYQWGLDRFIEEAQILARFDHPNIVRVYRYFRANATAYMVLQFEEGQHLKSWLRTLGRAPRQKELDSILGPLLDALDVIHAADYLHRDIAPDNIIIRNDGSPVLIDFGSARGEMAGHSKTVSALVKPGYSPYEQYAETSRTQGPWTDVYALAATLYTAITGKRPPDAPTRMVRDNYTPAAEAALGAYRKRFLGAIDKALNLRIEDRPQSIAAWRGELLGPDKPARFAHGDGANEPKARGGWRPGARRGSGDPSIGSDQGSHVPPLPDAPGRPGGILDYMDGLRGSTGPKAPAAEARQADRRARAHPGASEADVLSRPPAPPPAADPPPAAARGGAKETVKLTSPPVFNFPGFRRRKDNDADGASTAAEAPVLDGQKAQSKAKPAKADGKPAAIPAGIPKKPKPVSSPSSLRDAAGTDAAARPGFFARMRQSENANKAASEAPARAETPAPAPPAAAERALPALRPRQRPPRKTSYVAMMSKAAGWSRFAVQVAVALSVSTLAVANQDRMRDYLREAAIISRKTDIAGLANIPLPDQNPQGQTARDVRRQARAATASAPAHVPVDRYSAAARIDDDQAAIAAASRPSEVPPVAAYQPPNRTPAPTSSIMTAAIGRPVSSAPVSRANASGTYDSGTHARTELEAVSPSPAQSRLDQPVVADLAVTAPPPPLVERNPLLLTLKIYDGPVTATALTADDQRAVTVGDDATVKVVNLADGEIVRTVRLDHGPATAISIQKNLLATGHRGGFIGIWDLDTGAKVTSFRRNEADIWDVAFTATEGRLVAAAHDWKAALWDTSQPAAPLRLFEGHDNAVMSLAVSPDGRYLVTGGADRRVVLHDLDTLDEVRTFSRQPGFVKALAFSHDGDTVAAASLGGGLLVGTRMTRSLSGRLRGHDGDVDALAFSPEGDVLASAGADGTVRLWDVRHRRTLKTLAGNGGGVVDLAFSRDGQRLVSVDATGTLRVWSISAALD